MVTASAPGKLMLLGEHTVLYGQPCIVTAIDQRLEVSIEEGTDDSESSRFVEGAIRQVSGAWGTAIKGIRVSTTSHFAGDFGFGSSSAVTVATIAALSRYFKKPMDQHALFSLALRTVQSVQGRASGFDVAAAVFGGTLYYQLVADQPTIERIHLPDIPLVVGFSGTKASTAAQIEAVSKKRAAYPQKVDRIMAAIGKLVVEARQRLVEGDWERIGKLMDFNQEYLRDLGVSSEKLETLISAAKKAGAWGAKLSGAGGGDCMIALHPDGVQGKPSVIEAIQQAGGTVVDVNFSAEGVKIL